MSFFPPLEQALLKTGDQKYIRYADDCTCPGRGPIALGRLLYFSAELTTLISHSRVVIFQKSESDEPLELEYFLGE